MNHRPLPPSQAVAAYMCQNGWHPTPHPNPRLHVLSGPLDDFGKPVSLVLPASDDLADASLRVDEVLRSLATIEERPLEAVLADIQPPASTLSQPQAQPFNLGDVLHRLEHLEAIAQQLLADNQELLAQRSQSPKPSRRKGRSPKSSAS